jgi:insulysin
MEVIAKPVKDRRVLELTFTFPDLRPHFRSRPSHIISHIIGYEGAGSLLSYLKSAKHWVDSLSAGPSHVNAGTELFRISMTLTKEGLGTSSHLSNVVTQFSSL